MMRLNKYLADCGIGARRKCDKLIQEGQVRVNGVTETRLGVKINEKSDRVILNTREVKPVKKYEYILLNKPKGIITTVSDERNRKSVLDIIKVRERIFPVGRLDRETSGLLILTNDGDLTHKLTHPKYEIKKIYRVTLDRDLTENDRKEFQSGVKLDEGITGKCTIEFLSWQNRKNLEVTLRQGWNRQIRRMFAVLGYEVITLKRVGLGFLNLKGLRIGQWRRLTSPEVKLLKAMSNGNQK